MSEHLDAVIARARSIRARYAELERTTYGREWTLEELALGLVGDVGDLAKLIQAVEGVRAVDGDAREALAHELADVLWSVIVVADRAGIDLGHAFAATMDELDARLAQQDRLS